jgi:hypothetical protein
LTRGARLRYYRGRPARPRSEAAQLPSIQVRLTIVALRRNRAPGDPSLHPQLDRSPVDHALNLLAAWLEWARDSTLAPFQRLADTITEQRAGIEAAIRHRLSNARVEAINTQIRLLTRRAFGFHSPDALIALAMLSLADLCPPLPR